MRRICSFAGAVLLLGCMDGPENTTAPKLSGALVTGATADRKGFGDDHGEKRLILTMLTGDEEVPPRATDAHGQAHVKLSKDGTSMDFVLVANQISNVVQAHIHMGPKGANGPIVVWLYPNLTGPVLTTADGLHNGLLAKGTFTAANFVNTLAGKPMADLVAAIAAGNAYVNVHTNDGVAPANTGPGDFPGGEIRGQLDKNGH